MVKLSTARQNAILLIALLAMQLFLMSDGAQQSGVSATLERVVMRVSSPCVGLADLVAAGTRGAVTNARDLLTAHARNAALESEVQRLRSDLVRHREAEPENQRLRKLLGMREAIAPRSIAASVVTSNLNGKTRIVIVDRGRKDGVQVDSPVVAWGGAVGRVVAADAHTAKVRLLNDASSGVAGIVQRSRAQGIVLGGEHASLNLLYVPQYADVLHGDRVVTSGLDGIFPRGFGIGSVGSITEEPNGTQTIHLEPELDYASIEEVLILLEPEIVEIEVEAETRAARGGGGSSMSALRAILVLAVALLLQAGLGRLFPGIHAYVDVLLVPVAIYGVGSSQRAAVGMGCASGLLSDTWFLGGPFGMNGFKRTLLGWTVGALMHRFDLNQPVGRFFAGALVSVGDDVLDLVLRAVLDENPHFPTVLQLVVRAGVTGLLSLGVGGMLERRFPRERARQGF